MASRLCRTPVHCRSSMPTLLRVCSRPSITSRCALRVRADLGQVPSDISRFVTWLTSSSTSKQQMAESALLSLAETANSELQVGGAGAIMPLVGLLKSRSDSVRRTAAGALRQLAERYESDKDCILGDGAVASLIGMLGSDMADVQESAAAGLCILAVSDRMKVKIAEAGGIIPLVELLGSRSAAVQEMAARALSNLARCDENELRIADAGAVAPLISLLTSGVEVVQEKAASALSHLAAHEGNRVKIADAGAIAPLVHLLGSRSEAVQQKAALALKRLAERHDGIKVRIAHAGAIAPLVDLLVSRSHEVQEKAAWALWTLAWNEGNSLMIAEAVADAALGSDLSESDVSAVKSLGKRLEGLQRDRDVQSLQAAWDLGCSS